MAAGEKGTGLQRSGRVTRRGNVTTEHPPPKLMRCVEQVVLTKRGCTLLETLDDIPANVKRNCFDRADGTACTWHCGLSLAFSQRLNPPGGETGQPSEGSARVPNLKGAAIICQDQGLTILWKLSEINRALADEICVGYFARRMG